MTTQTNKTPYVMISILFVGAFVSFLNNSLLNVALPSIMVDLEIENYSTVQWLATGEALLAGIQYSFYVALAINILALILSLFMKRVDTSDQAVKKIEKEEESVVKPALI